MCSTSSNQISQSSKRHQNAHLDKGDLLSEVVKEVEGTTDASAVVASDRSTEDLEGKNVFYSSIFDNDDIGTTIKLTM